MADEAFALSPISASASLPTDNDYDAICDAFMETSRGRWFLREYTKRNRNADTQMVLEAVARIEESIARQKQEEAEAPPPAPDLQADIVPAMQAAILEVRSQIEQCFVQEDNKLALDLIKGGMDTIRNVAWALRERGVDLQICGIFDHQVSLMMDGYLRLVAAQATATAVPEQVLAAFDGLLQRLSAIAASGNDAAHPDEPAAADARSGEPHENGPATLEVAHPYHKADPVPAAAPVDADTAFREIYGDEHDIEIIESPLEEFGTAGPSLDDSDDDDFIRAIADTAQELARLEPMDTLLPPHPIGDDVETRVTAMPGAPAHAAEHQPGFAVTAALSTPEPVPPQPVTVMPVKPQAVSAPLQVPAGSEDSRQTQDRLTAGTSLGHALLRNGIVRADGPRPNPMGVFERMSQAEKIAFMT